jgi:DNA polymerase-4
MSSSEAGMSGDECQRILCARYDHLSLIAAWQRYPELRGEPVVVGGAPELRLPVLAASASAQAAGVRSGQPLREAQQRCPAAVFVTADESAISRLRDALLAELYRQAPVVEVGDEVAFCDLTGRHAAHSGEPGWAAAIARGLVELLDDAGLAVGVAGSRFVAAVAAQRAGPRRIRRIAPGEEAGFLAPLPLSVLALDAKVAARLAGLGLDCVGDIANLSAADLQRQFGPVGMDLWRQVHGQDGGGVAATQAPRRLGERLVLEGSVGNLEALRFTVHRCAQELGERLQERGCRAAAISLVCELEDAEPVGLRVTPLQPPGSGVELWPLALELLAGLRLEAPVEAVRLEIEGLQPGTGRQVDLWRGGDAAREAIAGAASRLRGRFGGETVRQPVLTVDPGDLPERRFRWADAAVAAETLLPVTATTRGRAAAAGGSATRAAPRIPALRR